MLNESSSHAAIDLGRWIRTWVEIDLSALERNTRRIATHLTNRTRLIVSLKKDAYGHGLLPVARCLAARPEVAMLGLACLEEGLLLRQHGIQAPILLFSPVQGDPLEAALEQNLSLTITNLAEAQAANETAKRLDRKATVHFKLDTGMGRLGRLPGEVADQVRQIAGLPFVRLEATYSHLADAWDDPPSATRQWRILQDFRAATDLQTLPQHWGGSDALTLPIIHGSSSWIRSGIALFGDHPGLPDLEPVMTFKSRVVFRRSVPAGTPISYGSTFVTQRPTELAVVGAGYGNGLMRSLSNCGEVLMRGIRCPMLGRVCMDQVVVDVTDHPEIRLGEEAVLFGRQGSVVLSVAEVARKAGTISYELFCLAGQLNPKIVTSDPS